MSTHSKTHPFQTHITERMLLNKPGSTKAVYHLVLPATLLFKPGDSVGVLPENNPAVVDEIVKLVGNETVSDPKTNIHTPFSDYLLKKANLSKCTSSLLKRLEVTLEPPFEVIDLLRRSTTKVSCQELCNLLLPLMPRFYSIASSAHMFPNEIHLTVAFLTYTIQGEVRHGIGSDFLCHRATLGQTPVDLYVQPSNGFTLPEPMAPILLIGPGTGVAPFRAFLQERMALGHEGKNWLFFGERNQKTDFYYEDFFRGLEHAGKLRLDAAFSRDGAEKTYVQHKLWDARRDVWQWLQDGAFVYVCGDAEKMAKDVEATFMQIAGTEGGMDNVQAREWLKGLRKERRYLQDVY